jgi:alcohol dehydrogenase
MYIAPNSIVYKVSQDMTPEAAVLINAVIANGIQWIRIHGGASIQSRVVIQGTGPQGLAATIAARESGASPIIVTGLMPEDKDRFALAKEFGADYTIDVRAENVVERVKEITQGKMADLVLDVTGNPQVFQKSIELAKKQGTVVLGSLTGKMDTMAPIPTEKLSFNEIRLQGVFSGGGEAVVSAIKLVESKRYPVEKMVTHRFPLEKAEEAVKTAGREIPGVFPVKTVIVL